MATAKIPIGPKSIKPCTTSSPKLRSKGVLMNSRGLVELVLNAALDLGVCSPELFTLMLLMALIATFMTSRAQNDRTLACSVTLAHTRR